MTGPLAFLLVAVGGGVGAAARFVVADAIRARRATALPWGTVTVNAVGSLAIGVVAGVVLTAGADDGLEPWRLLLATGLCGGFTTFSTATVEAVTLLRGGHPGRALATTAAHVLLSLAGVALGLGTVLLLA